MRYRHIVSIGALLLALPGYAAGQDVAPGVTAGTRVRVRVPDTAAQRQTPFLRAQFVRGEVTRVSADTLFVRPAPRLGELPIPMAEVKALDMSLGPPRRSTSALLLGVENAAAFALAGALLYSKGEREFGVTNRGEAAALGAGVGLVGGAIIGALAPFERWKRVRLPTRQ